MKILTVYYSWSHGNTGRIAKLIQKTVGGDVEEIEMASPYKRTYDEMVAKSHEEVNRGAAPAVKPLTHSIDDYDLVFVGTPTWWYTMASPVLSFLKGQDWKGRQAAFFMTNAGWPGHVISDMKKAAPGADVKGTLEVRFDSGGSDHLETPESEIQKWASEMTK